MRLSAIIGKEGGEYVALCPELDVASQGDTIEEALANLREAVELYLEDEKAEVPSDASPFVTTFEVKAGNSTFNMQPLPLKDLVPGLRHAHRFPGAVKHAYPA